MSITNASSVELQKAILTLKGKAFKHNEWLPATNHYKNDIIDEVKKDQKKNSITSDADLSQYIGVSGTLHLFDGWTYFAQAVKALLGGNFGVAIHLAYYAELRGAMSLLALTGAGIFNGTNVYIDSNAKISWLLDSSNKQLLTHKAVWYFLEEWATNSSSTIFLESISVNNKSLSNWLRAAGIAPTGGTSISIEQQWLREWSMDIREFDEDRNVRNDVSYTPQWISSKAFSGTSEHAILELIHELWVLSESIGAGQFNELDTALLRSALVSAYQGKNGQITRRNKRKYEQFIDNAMKRLGFISYSSLRLQLHDYKSNNHLFKLSTKPARDKTTNSLQPTAVISRAFLLLRMASATCLKTLTLASVSPNDLLFWRNAIGRHYNFWKTGGEPSSCVSLWNEVSAPLADLQDYYEKGKPTTHTVREARDYLQSKMSDLSYLEEFQRVGLWALGL